MAIMELSNTEIEVVSGGTVAETLGTLFGSLVNKYLPVVMPHLAALVTAFMAALFAPAA